MKKITGLLTIICFLGSIAKAQQAEKQQALQVLQQLSQAYQQAKLLSFDVSYTYAAEADPVKKLDSLKGQCKIDGSKYWSRIDETESVYDNDLLLMVFKEEQLIYLAKPTATQRAASNPIAMLDSFVIKNPGFTYAVRETEKEKIVSINMLEGQTTKQASYYINKQTGYLARTISLVRADQLYDPSVQNLIKDAASSYVVVETIYANYRQGDFDASIFNMNRYIKKEGTEYLAVQPYEQYKVFLGSSGL